MYDTRILHRAQTLNRKKIAIPEDLLAQFCGFTHVTLKIYCRKIDDPKRRYKKSARPYEGFILLHLTDTHDHMDQQPYCVVTFHNCSITQFRAVIDKIATCSCSLETFLAHRALSL